MYRVLLIPAMGVLLTVAAVRDSRVGAQQGPQSGGQSAALAEPFVGITTDGRPRAGLFPIRATGVSTGVVREAARAFLGSLTPSQRSKTTFAADDVEWRDWNNVHRAARKGVSFLEMSPVQRERAYDLFRASLSAEGFEEARGIMRLNGHLAELLSQPDEYGEFLYYITVMGDPSASAPWGWQLDGHHLVVNYFVLGDQVVMTPTFMGSEPVSAGSGPYAGTVVLGEEETKGLALMAALRPEQRTRAIVDAAKVRNNAQAQAFRDNLTMPYQGIRGADLDAVQQTLLVDLIAEYVGNMREGHARVRMDEVRAHLDETYFSWVGAASPGSVFYYRIQSPVVLIEFDHQTPVALDGPRVPDRRHVHSVVRTPNGNDYGKDLLRQHYDAHRQDPAHGHAAAAH